METGRGRGWLNNKGDEDGDKFCCILGGKSIMATWNFEVCSRISPKFGDEDGDFNFGEIPHPTK